MLQWYEREPTDGERHQNNRCSGPARACGGCRPPRASVGYFGTGMLKLYRLTDTTKEYWETWDNEDGSHTVHWGELGTRGQSKIVKSTLFRKAQSAIQKEIDGLVQGGFLQIESENHFTVLIEYAVDGMGTTKDLEKRHRLEDRMNETLGWTGLGACDGGSTGSGSMEVCNFVVDFNLAKAVIEADLAGTEFDNYTRIFDENATTGG